MLKNPSSGRESSESGLRYGIPPTGIGRCSTPWVVRLTLGLLPGADKASINSGRVIVIRPPVTDDLVNK